MATGCVPIVSDIPVFNWILGADAPLLSSPVTDAEGYAKRLCALARAPDVYMALQGRLRHRQATHFRPDVTVGRYLHLIHRLSETRAAREFHYTPFRAIDMPAYHKRRCTRLWRALQVCRYGFSS